MTRLHFGRHKTQGNDPLLQGSDKFRQQRTGELTGQRIENELKVQFTELENTQGRVWVAGEKEGEIDLEKSNNEEWERVGGSCQTTKKVIK